MLKQLKAEMECFKRKISNLEDSIESGDMTQVEIEFTNIVDNFEHVENELNAAQEELDSVEETIYDTELYIPVSVVIEI